MRLKWDANVVDVDVSGLAARAAVVRVLSHPVCASAIEELARGSLRKAKVAGRLDEKDAVDVARTCLRSGRDAAVSLLMDLALPDVETLKSDVLRAAFRKSDSLPSCLRDGLDREIEDDLMDIVEAIREGMGSALVSAIGRVAVDVVGKRLAVELRHEVVDVGALSFSGRGRDVSTVEADAAFSALFEIANADVGAFLNRVRSRKGVDLRAGDEDVRLLAFLSSHSFGHSTQGARAAARLWERFSPACDVSRDPVLTSDDMLAVLERAPVGAVPACVVRAPLCRMLDSGLDGILADADGVFVGVLVPDTDEGCLLKARAPVVLSGDGWKVVDANDRDDPAFEEETLSSPGYR